MDLAIPRGVTAVLGPSGSGKTSLLNLLVGFEEPDEGTVESGFASKGTGAEHALPLFWVPPGFGLWPHLGVRGHLQTVSANGRSADGLLAAFGLEDLADARPERLSQGERARLSVARALAADPEVLVMDEPLVHVGPAQAEACWAAVRAHLGQRGASLVFSTHDPGRARELAGFAVVLDEGRVAYSGDVGGIA